MRQQGGGHIVDIVSGIAFAPMAQMTQYSATKAALNALTLALRYELWDENIRVSSATPGVTATGIWKASGVPPPPRAQSAEQSAQTILAGVAKNERLVLGDQDDISAPKSASVPRPRRQWTSICSRSLARGVRASWSCKAGSGRSQ